MRTEVLERNKFYFKFNFPVRLPVLEKRKPNFLCHSQQHTRKNEKNIRSFASMPHSYFGTETNTYAIFESLYQALSKVTQSH
jgi:hypothetical protein